MRMSDKGDLRTASNREACGLNVADRPSLCENALIA